MNETEDYRYTLNNYDIDEHFVCPYNDRKVIDSSADTLQKSAEQNSREIYGLEPYSIRRTSLSNENIVAIFHHNQQIYIFRVSYAMKISKDGVKKVHNFGEDILKVKYLRHTRVFLIYCEKSDTIFLSLDFDYTIPPNSSVKRKVRTDVVVGPSYFEIIGYQANYCTWSDMIYKATRITVNSITNIYLNEKNCGFEAYYVSPEQNAEDKLMCTCITKKGTTNTESKMSIIEPCAKVIIKVTDCIFAIGGSHLFIVDLLKKTQREIPRIKAIVSICALNSSKILVCDVESQYYVVDVDNFTRRLLVGHISSMKSMHLFGTEILAWDPIFGGHHQPYFLNVDYDAETIEYRCVLPLHEEEVSTFSNITEFGDMRTVFSKGRQVTLIEDCWHSHYLLAQKGPACVVSEINIEGQSICLGIFDGKILVFENQIEHTFFGVTCDKEPSVTFQIKIRHHSKRDDILKISGHLCVSRYSISWLTMESEDSFHLEHLVRFDKSVELFDTQDNSFLALCQKTIYMGIYNGNFTTVYSIPFFSEIERLKIIKVTDNNIQALVSYSSKHAIDHVIFNKNMKYCRHQQFYLPTSAMDIIALNQTVIVISGFDKKIYVFLMNKQEAYLIQPMTTRLESLMKISDDIFIGVHSTGSYCFSLLMGEIQWLQNFPILGISNIIQALKVGGRQSNKVAYVNAFSQLKFVEVSTSIHAMLGFMRYNCSRIYITHSDTNSFILLGHDDGRLLLLDYDTLELISSKFIDNYIDFNIIRDRGEPACEMLMDVYVLAISKRNNTELLELFRIDLNGHWIEVAHQRGINMFNKFIGNTEVNPVIANSEMVYFSTLTDEIWAIQLFYDYNISVSKVYEMSAAFFDLQEILNPDALYPSLTDWIAERKLLYRMISTDESDDIEFARKFLHLFESTNEYNWPTENKYNSDHTSDIESFEINHFFREDGRLYSATQHFFEVKRTSGRRLLVTLKEIEDIGRDRPNYI